MRRAALLLSVLLCGALICACGGAQAPLASHEKPRRVYSYGTTRTTTTTSQSRTTAKVTNARPQANWRHTLAPVPILVYHDLGNAPASEPYPGLYMPYATFEREMAWLHSRGYEAVTLDELINDWERGGTLPAKPIVITFDNGYPPQVTEAPRVMSKYGWPGVLNEITQDHLYPAQVRSVLDRGWEVDSHSLSHPDLTTLSASDLRAQVVDSRRFLQRTFHIPVNSFCYPSSKYNATVVSAVKAAGYEDAVTEGEAYATPSDSPFLLPRFEMTTGLPQLEDDLAEAH